MARPRKEEPTDTLMVRVPATLKKELKIKAAELETSMSQIILDGYELWKKKHQGKKQE